MAAVCFAEASTVASQDRELCSMGRDYGQGDEFLFLSPSVSIRALFVTGLHTTSKEIASSFPPVRSAKATNSVPSTSQHTVRYDTLCERMRATFPG